MTRVQRVTGHTLFPLGLGLCLFFVFGWWAFVILVTPVLFDLTFYFRGHPKPILGAVYYGICL
jgi:hypothetical protein